MIEGDKMKSDIENRRWLNVALGLQSISFGLIKNKKLMEEYAKELGWIVETSKEGVVDEEGNRLYDVLVIPNEERLLSPEELRQIKDKLIGFSLELLTYIDPTTTSLTAIDWPVNMLEAKKPEDVMVTYEAGHVLSITYKLVEYSELDLKVIHVEKVSKEYPT